VLAKYRLHTGCFCLAVHISYNSPGEELAGLDFPAALAMVYSALIDSQILWINA
jgi:hypothetical protein